MAEEVGVARTAVMRSPAHRIHAAMGVVFERRGQWEVPRLYGSEPQEIDALESGLGFADVSARGKIHLSGAVDDMIRTLTGGGLDPLATAPITSGGLAARIARDWALALVAPSKESDVLDAAGDGVEGAMATDITSAMCAFLVAGPRLAEFMARSITMDPAGLRPGRCAAVAWSRIPAVLVARALPAPAVELYVSSDHGRYAWETIRRLGGHLDGSPVGWQALEAWGWK
ncbi:MAG: hypothetical protein ACHQ0J_06015 [Candidatus Dormibacterales bacterium]